MERQEAMREVGSWKTPACRQAGKTEAGRPKMKLSCTTVPLAKVDKPRFTGAGGKEVRRRKSEVIRI
jgi:hypothetical protein